MEFENLSLARDFFYLSFLLVGATGGSLWCIFKRTSSLKSRSGWISAALVFFSGAVAAIAGAVIFSRAGVFSNTSLYVLAGIALVLGVLAVRFPRSGACSIVIALGFCAVWICLSFLRYPASTTTSPEGISVLSAGETGEGMIIVRQNGEEQESWNLDTQAPLEFEAVAVSSDFRYPLVGGITRGLIVQAVQGTGTVFRSSKYLARSSGSRLGFTFSHYTLTLPAGALLPGMSLSVLFDGEKLYFDPPIQLP
jgi:hypothetical protein